MFFVKIHASLWIFQLYNTLFYGIIKNQRPFSTDPGDPHLKKVPLSVVHMYQPLYRSTVPGMGTPFFIQFLIDMGFENSENHYKRVSYEKNV